MKGGADTGQGMIHVPGEMQWRRERFHQAAQNGASFKTYELFTSGIFLFIFLDLSGPQVTVTLESETEDEGGLLCLDITYIHPPVYFKPSVGYL